MDYTTLSDTPAIVCVQIHSCQIRVCNQLQYACVKYQSWEKCEGNVATTQGGVLKLKGPYSPFKTQCDEKVNGCWSAVTV